MPYMTLSEQSMFMSYLLLRFTSSRQFQANETKEVTGGMILQGLLLLWLIASDFGETGKRHQYLAIYINCVITERYVLSYMNGNESDRKNTGGMGGNRSP